MLSYLKIKNYRNFKDEYVFDFDFDPENPENNLKPMVIFTESPSLYRDLYHLFEKVNDLFFYYEFREDFLAPPPNKKYGVDELDEFENNQISSFELQLYLDKHFYTCRFISRGNELLNYEFIKDDGNEADEEEIENVLIWVNSFFNLYQSTKNLSPTSPRLSFYVAERYKNYYQTNVVKLDVLRNNDVHDGEQLDERLADGSQKIYIAFNYQLNVPNDYVPSNIYCVDYNDYNKVVLKRYSPGKLKVIKTKFNFQLSNSFHGKLIFSAFKNPINIPLKYSSKLKSAS